MGVKKTMIEIKQLSNGLRVVLEPMPYLQTAAFGVWVKVGSVNETSENNGIAHMIEHMLFKGTTNRTAKQIADETAFIGGDMNAFTSKECTSYYVTTLSEHLEKAIEITGDMINNSIFDKESLRKEKGVIIEEIDMYDDSPEDLVHEILQKRIWDKHPLGFQISGTKTVVRKTTRDDILTFKNAYYVADRMVISCAGNYDTNRVMELLEEQFGHIKKSAGEVTSADCPTFHKVLWKKQKDVEQLHLNLAFEGVSYESDSRFVYSILNSVYGSSINSRLFMTIREEMGSTYSIYSYGSSHEFTGLHHIYAAMNPTQAVEVVKKSIDIMEEIKKNSITEKELAMTKEQLKTELIMGNESAKSRMNSNAKAILLRGEIIPFDEVIKKVNEVTLDDVKQFANELFNIDQCALALVGNLEGIGVKELRKLLHFS